MYLLLTLSCIMTSAQAQGLYFTLNGTVYLHGDTVHITDIGAFAATTLSGAASSLACDTSNVNTQCCRTIDGGNVGEWFFPNGTIIPRNSGNGNADFTRSGFTHQVRLNRKYDALMPTGEYSCRVPDGRDSTLTHMATITLIAVNVSIPAMLNVTEGVGMVSVCTLLSITPATATSRTITVSLATNSHTATPGSDYIPVSMELTFSAGSIDGNTRCITINIIEDNILERDETFTVTMTTSVTYMMLRNDITIIDDDVPTPVVSISVSPGPLVAGGVGDTTLKCSAMVDLVVVDSGMIRYVFTWLDRHGNMIVSGGRTTITPSFPSLSTSPYSFLIQSPLSTEDTNFTCGVTVKRMTQNTAFSSEPTMVSTPVNVTTPADPVVDIVVSTGSTVAGTTLTLTCTVTLLQQLRETTIIVWVGPDGTEVQNGTIANVIPSSFTPQTGTLMFSPLHTNYGGEYRCRASLDIAEAGVSITNSSIFTITVQIPPPTVTITGSPVDSDFFTGLRLILTCSIHIPQELQSQPVQVSAHWTKGGSNLTSNSQVTVEEGPVRARALLYQSTLVFSSLDGSRDSEEYSCTGSINSSTSTSVYSIDIHTIFFQLEISRIADCHNWRLDDPSAKDRDVVDAIVENVVPRCGCDFRGDRITDRVFQCFPSSPQSVTYHAQLHGTLNANVLELFTAIEEWVSSGVTIPVQFLPRTVSSVCAVSSSTPLEHCPGEVTTDPLTQFDTTSEDASNPEVTSGTFNFIPIVAAVSAVIVIAIVIVVTVIVCVRHRHSAMDFKTTNNTLTSPPPPPVQAIALNPLPGVAGGYEDVILPGEITKDYTITECPAYRNQYQKSIVPEGSDYVTIPVKNVPEESDYVTIPVKNVSIVPEGSDYVTIPVKNEKSDYANIPVKNAKSDYANIPVTNEKSDYANIPVESDYANIPA